MIRPKKVKAGDEILASKINELIDAIMERTPLTFHNGFLTTLPHGYHVRSKGGGSSAGGESLESLQLINTSTEETKKLRVLVGTIGGTYPDGMSPGDDPVFELSGFPDSGYVLGKVTYTVSTGEITSTEIIQVAEMPETSEGVLHIDIGSWSIDDEGAMHVVNTRYGPINLSRCRDYYQPEAKYFLNVS